jgi:hypothetical protein
MESENDHVHFEKRKGAHHIINFATMTYFFYQKLLNCWYKERATGLVASTTLRACCPYVNNNIDSFYY